MPIKRVHIYDLDGTIIDSSHRYRAINGRIDLQFWRDNEHLAYSDSLLPLANQYWRDIADTECFTIIATARVLSEPDNRFIRDFLGIPNRIISRKIDDNQSGAMLKIKGIIGLFNLHVFKRAEIKVFEDNIQYLKSICDALMAYNVHGVYVPSIQGH